VLKQLRNELLQHEFAEQKLRKAVSLVHKKHLPDIISIIKNAAKKEPVMDVSERVNKAIDKLFTKSKLNHEQMAWIQYIKQHLIENLTLDKEDFEYSPILERHGGWGKFKKVFEKDAEGLIVEINAAIAA
jgi:type I restriction enzyme, R subunit